jgi:light-regulated signal transduction histidine kinase (bacteriophytochrome)
MNTLINALLEMSRFSRKDLKRQSVDLSDIVHCIAAELQQNDAARSVEFIIAEGITVQGDNELLHIVLQNLLNNAWKFTAQRTSGRIEFGVTLQADGSEAYFVRDNGAGYDMAFADRLFGPFQRLHSQEEFPGIGIGLATVQRIIYRHGGRVWAEGEVDKGATFYFTTDKVLTDPLRMMTLVQTTLSESPSISNKSPRQSSSSVSTGSSGMNHPVLKRRRVRRYRLPYIAHGFKSPCCQRSAKGKTLKG